MNLVVFQFKGGVGKSSIAINFALNYDMYFVTNDELTNSSKFKSLDFCKLKENLKRIPTTALRKNRDTIFDMGAMSGAIDHKTAHALELADGIIIPTLTDQRSIDGAIQSIKFVQDVCPNIFVIINRISKEDDYLYALNQLQGHIEPYSIFTMRETTLFKRVSKDGDEWYNNVHNEKGSYMLQKTMKSHQEIHKQIYDTTAQLKALKDKQ